MSSFPSKATITSLFSHLGTGNPAEFFKHVSPTVAWTVMGTHPCAGHYTSLEAFQKATFSRLGAIMKEPGIRLKVRNAIVDTESGWATVELVAVAECKSGEFWSRSSGLSRLC